MPARRIGLIGLGAIGSAIAELWAERRAAGDELAAVLVRPGRVEDTAPAGMEAETLVTSSLDAFLGRRLDIVIEAASHEAVRHYGEPVLERGIDFYLLSVGALADEALRRRLMTGARGGGRAVILAGALAGFDGLESLRVAGLETVTYTSIKPPGAWRGTRVDAGGFLDRLTAPEVIFAGTARAAAEAFPRNANLAAAVALAGAGFEQTHVELIADPAAQANTGRIRAVSRAVRLDVTLHGEAFDDNPKTSRITAMSAIAALQRSGGPLRFG